MAKALSYMHSKGFIHRDIKPENILMIADEIKLADFGWSIYAGENKRKTYCGTVDYLCPEIVNKKEYTHKIDVWSIGILAYELCCGQAPFAHSNDTKTKQKIKKAKLVFPRHFSENLRDFCTMIIKENAEERPEIESILSHPWLTRGDSKKLA